MDQVLENQFVKFDEVLLKCIFLDHRWGANLTKHLKSFRIIQYLKNKKNQKLKITAKKKRNSEKWSKKA